MQQWNSLVALSYAAKNKGVKRGMNVFEAMDACPNLKLVHVATIVDKNDWSGINCCH